MMALKNALALLLLVVASAATYAGTALEKESVCLSSSANECNVAVSRYMASVSTWLDAADSSLPGEVVDILTRYYDAARANDIRRLTPMFDVADGSREDFIQEARKNPGKYA